MHNDQRKAARCSGRHDAPLSWTRHRKCSGAPRGWFVVRGWVCACEVCEPEGRGEGEHYECWALNPSRVRLTYAQSGRIRVVAALPDEHFYIEPDEAPEVLVKRWLNALTHVERNA